MVSRCWHVSLRRVWWISAIHQTFSNSASAAGDREIHIARQRYPARLVRHRDFEPKIAVRKLAQWHGLGTNEQIPCREAEGRRQRVGIEQLRARLTKRRLGVSAPLKHSVFDLDVGLIVSGRPGVVHQKRNRQGSTATEPCLEGWCDSHSP